MKPADADQATRTRSVATGFATGSEAAGAAVGSAVAGVEGDPQLVLCFPSGLKPGLAASGAFAASGGATVAGMTGNGSFVGGEVAATGCAAIAFGAGWDTGVGVSRSARRAPRAAARSAVAEALRQTDAGRSRLLVLMLDTRSGDQAEALAGAYAAAGPGIPIIGGASGGSEPAQLAGRLPDTDSVIAVALAPPRGFGVGWAHGCRRIGIPAIATRTDGRFLVEIDGRVASEVYLERLGREPGGIGPEEFGPLAATHPLAQPELNGASRIRHVLGLGPKGSLECATHIPESAAIEFTRQERPDIVAAARRSAESAIADLGSEPEAILAFDCAGRKRALGPGIAEEVAALAEAAPPGVPTAGVFSHGELCRIRGAKGDRNHAIVVAALA